jgi:uncharacterized protein YodC (DUF2158 family)
MADEIGPGDVVTLKSGGPKMTVTQVGMTQFSDTLSAWCEWFDGNKPLKGTYAVAALEKVPPPVSGRSREITNEID